MRARVLAALRRPPRALYVCMAVAFVSAATWSALTPSFQTPDELVHAGYAQYVAEKGDVPRKVTAGFTWDPAEDQRTAADGVPFSLSGRPTYDPAASKRLHDRLNRPLGRVSEGAAGYAANNPPLYYALDAVAYRANYSAPYLDRLWTMRLVSALLAAFTVGFVYLFLRELLPRTRWAWTVGALAVAFQPVFGFVGGGVNNDNLVWTMSACVLWLLARSFRRGLTTRRAAGIGAALAAGMITKGTTFGIVPGVALGLLFLVLRAPREQRRKTLGVAAVALLVAGLPFAFWLYLNTHAYHRPANTTTSGATVASSYSLTDLASYLWQFYLPKLPFMTDQFPGPHSSGFPHYPVWDSFFQGYVGRFGWYQYAFPVWVSEVALGIWVVLLAFAGRALFRVRAALRGRWMELACYVAVMGGMLLLVNLNGYVYRKGTHVFFEQTRYLFPLLALYGALVAIAARGAGRYGPALGAAIVVLAFGHTVFSQALTVGRYYDYVGTPGFVQSGEAQRQNRLRPVTPGEPGRARPPGRAGP
jgi:4-amino-4-deoxy-L-arabinose transferase-like glycosyltransferase